MTDNHPDMGDRHSSKPILLLYQQKWIADNTPVAVIEKSRRIGLSWGEAAGDALLAAASEEAGGMDVWYISYNKEMTETFVGDVAFWSRIYSLAASEVEEFVFKDGKDDEGIQAYRVRFASGFTVTALSSAPRNIRSKKGKIVIDEAAFVENLKELLKAALALIMWGGRLVVISTHNGDDNDFNELVQEIRAGKKPYSLHRVTFDDALAQGLFQRICVKKGQDWSLEAEKAWRQEVLDFYGEDADEELFCIPSKGAGTYLTRNLIESCMDPSIPVLRWAPPAEDFVDWPLDRAQHEVRDWCEAELAPLLDALPKAARSYFGEDFGRSGDLTVDWPVLELTNLTLRTPFVVELRNAPYRTQEQILSYIVDRLPGLLGRRARCARQRPGPGRIRAAEIRPGIDSRGDAVRGLVPGTHAQAQEPVRGPDHHYPERPSHSG